MKREGGVTGEVIGGVNEKKEGAKEEAEENEGVRRL